MAEYTEKDYAGYMLGGLILVDGEIRNKPVSIWSPFFNYCPFLRSSGAPPIHVRDEDGKSTGFSIQMEYGVPLDWQTKIYEKIGSFHRRFGSIPILIEYMEYRGDEINP